MWNQFTSLSEEKIFNSTFLINSLFKMEKNDKLVQTVPKVHSIFDSKRVAIAIDECLIMFDDETFSDCKCIHFESMIDCLTVSPTGALVICGLANGTIHGIHIKGAAVFSVEINADHIDIDRQKTFVDIHQHNAEYYLICKNGQIYKLSNVEIDEMSQNIVEMDGSAAMILNETLSNNVLLDLIPTKQRPRGGSIGCSGLSGTGETFRLMYSSREYVYMKYDGSIEAKIPLPLNIGNIVSIQSCDDTTLALTDHGKLYELCQYTKLLIPRPMATDDVILCFNAMENNDDVELLALVESGASKETYLKIFDFPCMTCKFSLPVPKHSWILNQPISTANIYYICGECDDSNVFEHVEMRMISEVQPENRLKTLIKKGLLDEAEIFAMTFKLSLQPIYEAKATQILTDIGLIYQRNMEDVPKRFDDLLEMAKLITNTEFLLKMRSMEMHNRQIMQKFLKFLVAHVKFNNYRKEFEEINEQLLRLETLSLIDMHECDLQWQKFVNHPNLITYCFKFFETDIPKACLILRQHASSILPNLTDKTVLKTMNSIPQHASPFDIIQWMRHYLPIVTKAHPQVLPTLAEWTIQKTTSYQLLKDWPEIGLEFGSNMFHIFEEIDFLFPDTRRQYDICIEKFRRLINALEELSVLKIRFNLTLTFDDYMNESIEDSAFRILLRINLKNLKKLVDEFLFTIFNENGMDLLPTMVRYIDFLIRSRKNSNVWEERAVACTQLIHNEEEKLKCAIKILKSATVPWSKVLDPILKLRLTSHPLAADIINEYQMQKLKIMKLKYGWNPDAICKSKFQFVCRMVKINGDDLFIDLKEFVEGETALKHQSYFYCAHELARTGHIDRAIRFLDSLTNEDDLTKCCNRIVSITPKVIEDELDNRETFDQLIELLKYVLMKRPNDELYKLIQGLQGVQQLRHEFGMNVTLASLSDCSKTDDFLNKSLDKLIEILESLKDGFAQKAWTTVQRIASILRLDVVHVALKLSTRVDNVRFTCALAKIILDAGEITADNCSLHVDLAMLLIAQQCHVFEGPMTDNYTVSLSYPIAYNILFRADQFGIEDVRDLLNFTRIGVDAFSLDRVQQYLHSNADDDDDMIAVAFDQKSAISSVKRRDSLLVFEAVNQVSRSPVLEHKSDGVIKCLSLVMKTLVVDLKPKTSFYTKLKNLYVPHEEVSRTLLFTSIEHLIKVKLYNSAFATIQFIVGQQAHCDRILCANDTKKLLFRKMIKSALHQKEPNFDQIVPILKSDPDPNECLLLLKRDLKNGPVKINCLMLQEKYGAHTEDATRATSERETRLKYYYYMQLCHIDPSLKADLNFEIVTHEQMFKDLRCKIVNVQLLEKMSKDFQWNYQTVLICQIVTILGIQQLEFDTINDVMGNEHIVVNVTAEKIRAQCQPYLYQVTDTKQLASQLYELLGSINSYFYELYLCIIDILVAIRMLRKETELWSNILLFLKMKMVTKRTKRTSQMETDWWLKTQNDSGVLPKIAKYRFPFQMLIDHPLKDVLDDEVNVENCVQWFPLVQLHLNFKKNITLADIYGERDYYCMSAVKNSISKYKAENDAIGTEVWNLQPINNGFLQAILHLVKQMKDVQRIIFVLYFVCSHAPEGADQVEAAYECYKFAIDNEETLRNLSRGYETVIKIKRKYPMLKIQHLLHLYGLKDEKLFQLVEHPEELITALYQHNSLLKSDNKIDLNQVTKEIAELHGLNFHEIQVNLLKQWLCFSTHDTNETLEETFYNDLNASIVKIEDEVEINDESVARAYYILKSWEPKISFEFLISHVLPSDDESSVNTGRQLHVFDCLIKLVNEDTDTAFVNLVSTAQYIALKCVHDLHPFGFKFSVTKFQSYDKMRILKQLWSTNANNSKALAAISSICVGYDIYEPVIWNNLLKQMVNLHMTKELRTIIDTISAKHSLVHLDGLVVAWEYLIRMPFKNIHKVRSDEQDANMCRSLFLLQSCPVKARMNLIELAELCVRFQQIHVAAILIAFIGVEHRSKIIERIRKHSTETLKNDIIYLRELGIYPFVIDIAIKELSL